MSRKYNKELIQKVLEELSSGKTVGEISKKYSVPSRRIYDWKNGVKLPSSNNVEKTDKSEVKKTITSRSSSFNSTEDILTQNGMNPFEWEIEKYKYSTWIGSDNKEHYNVTLSAFNKEAVNSANTLSPIVHVLNGKDEVTKPKTQSNIKCAVILPDMQVGFRRNEQGKLIPIHDRNAIKLALQITNYLSPDKIVLLGDNLDLAELSKYSTSQDMYFTVQPSIVELGYWLAKLRNENREATIEYLEGNHECFSSDTEILTEKGWRYYDEVREGLKVATFNRISNTIEYQEPIANQIYNYYGKMIRINSQENDLLVTPNHRLLFSYKNAENTHMIKVGELDRLDKKSYMFCSGNNLRESTDVSFDILNMMAYMFNKASVKTASFEFKLETEVDVKWFYESIYRFLSEDKKWNYYPEQKKFEINKKTLNGIYEVKGADRDKIYKYFLLNDFVPYWMFKLSEANVDLFVKMYKKYSGQNEYDNTGTYHIFGHKTFLEGLQWLLVTNGYQCTLKRAKNSDSFVINFKKTILSHIKHTKKFISEEDYSGIVWDFTVPNDTLVVRRNGKVTITGNCRLNKYVNEKALPLQQLKSVNELRSNPSLSVPHFLGLKDLDINYYSYPSGRVAINKNLYCIHGDIAKGASGATVSEVLKNSIVSVIQGHIHRYEVATKTIYDAYLNHSEVTAASYGCLCKLDPGVVPGSKNLQNWQQGIGVVWYEDSGDEHFRQEFIPIINGKAIYQREIFESNENEEKIADEISKEMRYVL